MPVLTFREENSLEKALSGYQIITSTVCRIYTAQNNARQYSYTRLIGAIALVRDSSNCYHFKLVDLSSNAVVWEQELDCMTAFSFPDESDADNFHSRYKSRHSISPFSAPPPPPALKPNPRPAVAPPTVAVEQLSVTADLPRASTAPSSYDDKKSKKDKVFGFGNKSRSNGSKKGGIDKNMISNPSDFQHVSHVGYDPKTGYRAENIPIEWKAIFAKAGITEDHLKDKKTAKFITKFMQENANKAGMPDAPPGIAKNKRAPPPPPSKSGRAPPPPPPSRRPKKVEAEEEYVPVAPPPPSRRPFEPQQTFVPPPPPPPIQAPPIPSRRPEPEPVVRTRPPAYNDRSGFADRSVPTPPRRQPAPPEPSYSAAAPPPPPPPGAPPPPQLPQPAQPALPTRAVKPTAAAPTDLLSSIREAGGISALKKVDTSSRASTPPEETDGYGDDLAGALKNALMMRQAAMASSDTEDEESEEEWD